MRPRRGATRPYKGRAKKRAAPRRKAMVGVVKQVLRKMTEVKSTQAYNLGLSIRPVNAATFTSQIIQVSPCATNGAINQGVTQAARIGNRIELKKVWMRGTVVPNPYDVTVNPLPYPMQVTLFFFYDRTIGPNVIPDPRTDFYQFGATTSAFQNDLVDQWGPINTDKYIVVARRQFKLSQASITGTGATAAGQFFANNDFKFNQNFKINLTPYMPKRVVYNDNTSDPSTRSLYMMPVVSRADGGGFGSTVVPAGMQFVIDYQYTDI